MKIYFIYLLPIQKTVPESTITSGATSSKNILRYSTVLPTMIILTHFSYKIQ